LTRCSLFSPSARYKESNVGQGPGEFLSRLEQKCCNVGEETSKGRYKRRSRSVVTLAKKRLKDVFKGITVSVSERP
jgi:hypothetical protein